jgi:Transglycosylase SLT domain/Domain of unknown function (DUF4124)
LSKFLSGNKGPFASLSSFALLSALALLSGPSQAHIYRSVDANGTTKFTDVLPTEGRWEIVVRDKAAPVFKEPAYDPNRFTVDSGSRYASQIQAAATANNVDVALIRAVISAESGYNPSAVSRAGAVGLMQLMPETASRYNVADSRDPAQNIHGGTQYLRDLLLMFNNDLRLAIAAYNAGEQAVMKYGNRIPPYRETLAYVPKVMKFYERYRTGHASTGKPGYKRVSTAARNKGIQIRVSKTYMANRTAPVALKAPAG